VGHRQAADDHAPALIRERPAPFMVDMIRAIRTGQKTQTRREVRFNAVQQHTMRDTTLYMQPMYGVSPPPNPVPFGKRGLWRIVGPDYPDGPEDDVWSPYGAEGDRLWAREPWRTEKALDELSPAELDLDAPIHYLADNDTEECLQHWGRYRHARFMCRWMSRLLLEITKVRIQRLQEISREDAIAEGIVQLPDGGYGLPDGRHYHHTDPRQSYFSLWEHINGPGSVQRSPYVWATTFKELP
jgi:hypothetical protein